MNDIRAIHHPHKETTQAITSSLSHSVLAVFKKNSCVRFLFKEIFIASEMRAFSHSQTLVKKGIVKKSRE
jgi:hypothetical protein